MRLAKPKTYYYALGEYLKTERAADERSEFIDGEIYAMAGESSEHGEISMNLAAILGVQLRGTNCRGRIKDTKVKSGALEGRFGRE